MKIISQGETVGFASIGSVNEIYDTTEREIGTLFGKSLYRMLIETSTPNTAKTISAVYIFPFTPDFLTFSGSFKCTNGDIMSINSASWSSYNIVTYYDATLNALVMGVQNSSYCNAHCSIVLTYTKA